MTSSPARSSLNSSSSLTSSRSLLSRLRSPLQSKTRNFSDFYIQPDDPHRQYAPGDIISGSVILKILKPIRITHLVVTLHGYAQVFKNPNSPGDAYKNYSNTVGNGKGKKSGSYFGNGFSSLFEDEVILCGEGRLGEGVYHFNFELEFPSKGLPSSIDFERGTISYMLTSTLTRPTTISPTSSCDTQVQLMETIDVAPILAPKARVISLEPISRRQRQKTHVRIRTNIAETAHPQPPQDSSESTRNGGKSEPSNTAEESDPPGSPAPSDISFGSQLSSGQRSGTEYGIRSVNNAPHAPVEGVAKRDDKTITATVELSKGGFLRGDQIPIRIAVNHTKHVRSLKGIIMTLYRQARVDMHPALPVAPNSKGDKTKSEDYYPKSRTGLGGLSLSSAGSSHTFRKDLSQSFAPLFVDPRTLTADVKGAVRVPDEAFPTISNVPGAMISFKYFVEVVVDIQGKLSGLDRIFPNTGLVSVPTTQGNGGEGAGDSTGGMFSTWGGNFADTDSLRREKGIVSCVFEVIIGTKDSERNGKRRQQEPSLDPQAGVHEIPLGPDDQQPYPGADQEYYGNYVADGQYYDQYGYGQYEGDAPYYDDLSYQDSSRPSYPPPSVEPEEELSEKERIRRAEERLLPSAPPSEVTVASSNHAARSLAPSAPVLPEDDEFGPPYHASSSNSPPPLPNTVASSSTHSSRIRHAPGSTRTLRATSNSTSAPSTTAVTGTEREPSKPLPSLPPSSPAPTYERSTSAAPHYQPSSSRHAQPTDDKQELQRQRLELERSAPPTDRPEETSPAPSAPSAPPSAPPTEAMQNLSFAPSAPILDEGDEGLVGPVGQTCPSNRRGVGEALPKYRR